jgi:N-acetylneuraminate lyase
MSHFHGVWPALVTPFTNDNTVNIPVLRDLVDYLVDKKVDGFYVCGSTGEGVLMSVAERKLVVEAVLSQANGRVPVIVHVGAMALVDARDLARHACDHGSAGVSSILPPQYNNFDNLYAYFENLAAAVPNLPVLAYMLNSSYNNVELMRRLMQIPNLAGAKYTGPDVYEFGEVVRLRDENWTMLSGMDEVCLYASMQGAHGNIGSTLNFMPGVYRAIHECVRTGNLAEGQALQQRANRVTTIMIAAGFMGAIKQVVLPRLGFDCGLPRLPHPCLKPERFHQLQHDLELANFTELAAM